MECIPQELVDKFIDEFKDDPLLLSVCSRISRRWVDRSRRHLFRKIRFPALSMFAWYCNLFPADHSVHSYVREVVIAQQNQRPWVNMEIIRRGSEQFNAFRALETLALFGIQSGSTRDPDAIRVLSVAFKTAATSVKNLELANWKVSSTTLVDFICMFPSLDNLNIEEMRYLIGLPGWKPPPTLPSFAGHFQFKHRDGHGPVEKFLRLLSRLPLSFCEIHVNVDFSDSPDPIIPVLEKCSSTLVRAGLSYDCQRGATIREINATFPELCELFLERGPWCTEIVDDFTLKLLTVISSFHLSNVTLGNTAANISDEVNTENLRKADRTMFELAQRTGRNVFFDWHLHFNQWFIETKILPHLARTDNLGTLRIGN